MKNARSLIHKSIVNPMHKQLIPQQSKKWLTCLQYLIGTADYLHNFHKYPTHKEVFDI